MHSAKSAIAWRVLASGPSAPAAAGVSSSPPQAASERAATASRALIWIRMPPIQPPQAEKRLKRT